MGSRDSLRRLKQLRHERGTGDHRPVPRLRCQEHRSRATKALATLAVPAALLALLVRFRSSPVRLFIIWPDQAAGRRHVLVTMLRPNGEEEEVHADVHPTAAGGIKVRAGTRVRVNVYID